MSGCGGWWCVGVVIRGVWIWGWGLSRDWTDIPTVGAYEDRFWYCVKHTENGKALDELKIASAYWFCFCIETENED